MFTGIIEHSGTIDSLDLRGEGARVTVSAPSLVPALFVSHSIAVNGCCLTIVSVDGAKFSADLSGETLRKTSFGAGKRGLQAGDVVNLEQPLAAGQEFGGHFVLGHVDGTGRVVQLTPEGESWRYGVEIPEQLACYVVPKGSITIDGVSLTIAHWHDHVAEVAVIPYTYEHTNIRHRQPGDAVNLEADILGKYIERYLQAHKSQEQSRQTTRLTMAHLAEQGF